MLSLFKTKTSGENIDPFPFINEIGIVFALYKISPVEPLGIVYIRSVKL